MDNVLENDFNSILEDNKIKFNAFKNKTILITGATGLIGSLLAKFFLYANKKSKLDITVLALVRNVDKANRIFKRFSGNNLHYVVTDLKKATKINVNGKIDYIIHAASITRSKTLVEKPVDAIKVAINGTEKVLDLAVKKDVKSVVYLSSMEVYGRMDTQKKVGENDLGRISLSDPRSCYPEGKRMCEELCVAYVTQFNLNVKIARLAQTFGAGILPSESRVFAQFANSILGKKNIILHTEGKSEGNYVYTSDAIKAILILLIDGNIGEAYNVVNEESHTTIKNMAEMVIDNFGKSYQKVITEIPDENLGYAPETHMTLSSKKIEQIGWVPTVSLLTSYRRMIMYMKNTF